MNTITKRDRNLIYVSQAAEQAMVAAQRMVETSHMVVSDNGSIMLRNIYLYVKLHSNKSECRYELRSITDDTTVGVYVFNWDNPADGVFMTPDLIHKLNML